jgi:hypothetical protein
MRETHGPLFPVPRPFGGPGDTTLSTSSPGRGVTVTMVSWSGATIALTIGSSYHRRQVQLVDHFDDKPRTSDKFIVEV